MTQAKLKLIFPKWAPEHNVLTTSPQFQPKSLSSNLIAPCDLKKKKKH